MVLIIYALVIVIGAVMVIIALMQKKRDGYYNMNSKILLNVGVVIIAFSLAEKLPEFIIMLYNACPSHK